MARQGSDQYGLEQPGGDVLPQPVDNSAVVGIPGSNGFSTISLAADPTAADINDGDSAIAINTTSGNVFLAHNNGGVIVKVQLT